MQISTSEVGHDVAAVYLSVSEIKRRWGNMINYLQSGHAVFVLKSGRHVATLQPHKQK
jgi:antitoxin (DNA-binding transcriptional repressor) of toxin-antitoxin stability system